MGRRLALLLSVLSIFCLVFAPGSAYARSARTGPTLTLTVDATDAPRKLFRAQEIIPATPGQLTLYYPKWIPGEHGPTGPIINLAGLKFTAGGKTLAWQRDPVDMYAFHLDVPQGATTVQADLEFLAPTFAGGFTSGSSTTSHLAVLAWNWMLLSPPVANIDQLMIDSSLRLPPGWRFGTALRVQQQLPGEVRFHTVNLTTLIDSPVLAAQYFRSVPLSTGSPPVEMDIAADSPAALEASQQFTDAMRKLVEEAKALFGVEHYEHYNFLLTLSDRVAHFGLEHHQSNDSRVAERALMDEMQGPGYTQPADADAR